MKILRGLGIAVGVAVLLGIGIWQLTKEGETVNEKLHEESKVAGEVTGLKTITAYCQYGAASMAQMKGCYYHVQLDEIDRRQTNAAKWARGELAECRSDAGPYCGTKYREVLERRINERMAELPKYNEELQELKEQYGSN